MRLSSSPLGFLCHRRVLVLFLGIAGCGSPGVPPPVLTLAPAAFAVDGPTAGDSRRELCLAPGAAAESHVHVHERTVTMTVSLVPNDSAAGTALDVSLDGRIIARQDVAALPDGKLTLRAAVAAGKRTLRLSVPSASHGGICILQVALTQP